MPVKQSFYPINNGFRPSDGPRSLGLEFDFSSDDTIVVDTLDEATAGKFQNCQAIYVDNSQNANALNILVDITGQRIIVPAFASGAYPVFALEKFKATFNTVPASDLIVTAQLLNVPIASAQWGPVTVNANIAAIANASATDRSGTIAVAATSQQLMASNANRRGLYIANPSDQLETLYINFGATAAIPPGYASIELSPGQSYEIYGPMVPTDEISVIAATLSHPYIAKEFA